MGDDEETQVVDGVQDFISLFDEKYPKLTQEVRRGEIGGLDEIIAELDKFRLGIEHPLMYEIFGARPPKGFLLHGPPGVGKTYIAKYLSQYIGARFVDLPLSSFESKWVGDAEKKLHSHLSNFRAYYELTEQPVLVFFDEGEEVLKSRSLDGWHGPRVNVLLREMDGLGNTKGIIFGAATNHIDKIDSAVLRPGRLDFVITIPEYDARMLGDVYRAQRDARNRRSIGSYEPFSLSLEDCLELGCLSKQRNHTPADIAEIFRRSIEARIATLVHKDVDEQLERPELYLTKHDLLEQSLSYKTKDRVKNTIGFDILK